MLTQAILKEKLHYSIITGEFYWLKPKQGVKTDNVAGALNLSGHRKIMVNGKLYYAHRLAWFYCTGEFPKHEIDHKNGITDANQWLNLREATRSQNQHNTSLRSDNTSGYKGVTWNKKSKKWQAQIMANGKNNYLGCFNDMGRACAERSKAEKELHGEFARTI